MLSVEKIAVVIPCLNEASAVASLVAQVRKIIPNVMVVDDGSCDSTGELAAAAGAEVLRNDRPRGKGVALDRGLKHAFAKGFEWALVMDGDGQHAPSDLLLFLNAMTRAPLVVGNRMADQRAMPWVRRTVNRWMSACLSRLAGRVLPDTQCGFRLIELKCWEPLHLRTAHFETESELLLAFIAAGHPVEFVPIQVIYKNERSKIHPVRDTLRWFRWLMKARGQFRAAKIKAELSVPPASRALRNEPKPSLR